MDTPSPLSVSPITDGRVPSRIGHEAVRRSFFFSHPLRSSARRAASLLGELLLFAGYAGLTCVTQHVAATAGPARSRRVRRDARLPLLVNWISNVGDPQ